MVLMVSVLLLMTTAEALTGVNDDAAGIQEEVSMPQSTEQEELWRTVLVNPWHALPQDYQTELVSLKNGLQVDKRIYDDLNAMLIACREEGLQPIVCSAYRSYALQQRLYSNKVLRLQNAGYGLEVARKEAARWVAVPGTSEHQTGLALDIVSLSYQLLDQKQEKTAEQQWLMEHCWEYGFILRYPADKCEITGIGYEPWHYRYVGRETAAELQRSGLCLEEYLVQQDSLEETAKLSLFFGPIPT